MENLLLSLQWSRISNIVNRVFPEGAKDGRFTIKRLYKALEGGRLWKILRSLQKWGFLLGGNLVQDLNCG